MDQADLDALIEFLRFPSISTDPASKGHVNDCADWLVERLRRGGLDVEKHPTAGHPVVLAKNKHQAGRKTVICGIILRSSRTSMVTGFMPGGLRITKGNC